MEAFRAYCEGGLNQEECVKCTFRALEDLKGKRRKDAEQGKTTSTLRGLKPGQRGMIAGIKARGEVRNRILAMDIRPGAIVEIERLNADTDQVEIKMRGYHLSLRKDDANKVIVELL
jgi:DtxR family Mn-dependent transcriptional regulator